MADLAPKENLPEAWQPLAVHPVDIPLDTLKGAMEYAVGQELELGIPDGENHHFDEDVTRSLIGGPRFLAYGAAGSKDLWEFRLGNKSLEKLDPTWSYAGSYLRQREEFTGVDQRHMSRIMVADAEVKPLGDFTRNALFSVLNIPPEQIVTSGINLGNVSHSQANRIIEVTRNQYADGNWRQTLQLAMAVPHIREFIRMASETSYRENDIVTIADSHIDQELLAEFRTDVDLLVARALKRGVMELRTDGRKHAADHAEAWLSMHEEDLTLDSFTPEVTIDDILTRPSYLNPRPDKDVPVISSRAYLVGDSGSRNYTIKYDDGSVYAVDYPTHGYGARSIQGKEEQGYRGNMTDGSVHGFVHTKNEWLDFEQTVSDKVSLDLVREIMQKGASFKQESIDYTDTLRTAGDFVDEFQLDLDDEQLSAVKSQLAAVLIAAQCVDHTTTTVGIASSMFEYSLRGWGSKIDIEEETGIRLTFGDGLSDETKQAYNDFGSALYGYELARLAKAYVEHAELSDHITKARELNQLTEDEDHYYELMMDSMRRVIGSGITAELVGRYFTEVRGNDRFQVITSEPNG